LPETSCTCIPRKSTPRRPPKGTGKTSTIAAAIRALVEGGARVLVSAYTNSAVDNILVKLAQLEVSLTPSVSVFRGKGGRVWLVGWLVG
jgi:superfamily I DNA/RNA helicase